MTPRSPSAAPKQAQVQVSVVSAPARHGASKPPPSWAATVLMVVVGGLALFSDGYNAQVAAQMNPVFAQLYPREFTPAIRTALSNAFLVGQVFGMLFFGWAIDRLGRRRGIMGATAFLLVGIAIASAAHGTSPTAMFWVMIVGRGIAGFGAGGEYPTCGASTAEASDETPRVRRSRGLLTAVSTCFAIDFGFVMAGLVVLIVLAAYHSTATQGLWRVSFAVGLVLPLVLLGFRLRLVDSTQYRRHAIKTQIPYRLVLRRYWKPMLGTSLSWFVYDFVYPFSLFGSTILATLNPENKLVQTVGYATLLNSFLLPGCLLGGVLMDRIGRKQTMTLGFVLWGLMGLVIGGALNHIVRVFPLFVILYGIFNTLGDMGPGVATFVCAAESFPTPVRGHFLGFAAALGKAGAAIGTQVFNPVQNSFQDAHKGVQAVFLIGAGFALGGGLVSWFLVPDKERELEDEDAKFRRYLQQCGHYDGFGEVALTNGALDS
ncbi:hypothetical protein CDD82_6755 [Ophiocordyceps australis]|uniref:Major facilitator superfamily (MFS) profile domain-containing protein n=1 Tax=Ophiocordyceps australis TaxID=1399860 RepID=A0A2C5XYZ0_9HYPO|nr:hypothetical protein CDD82_6755 [Ophiocordyceps australis]